MPGSATLLASNFNAATATTITVACTLTAGRKYAIGVIGADVGATVSAADTLGNTYTHRGGVVEAAIARRHHGLTMDPTTTGATTITITYPATADNRQVYVLEVSSVGAYDAFGTATDTGNNPTTAATATNTAQPAFCLAAILDYQGGAPTVGTIGGAAGTNVGTLFTGSGMLEGRAESNSVTSVGSQSANFGNAGFNRTTTVFWIFLEDSAPLITAQPADQNVNAGATANFSVTATGATSYQWKKNGSNVGTNSSSYSLTAAYADQGAQITVDCINGTGTTTSSAATLRVAFNLAGTGQRAETPLGNGAFAAGAFESYLRGTASAGGGASVGTATETDTALPLGSARPAGVSTEADTALALARVQVRAAGLSVETDTALALARLQIRSTGLATETDTALALGGVTLRSVGLASEADTALALAAVQVRATGRADEIDSALALSAPAGSAAGLAVETDSAFALSAVQIRAVGLATETDTALALSANVGSAAGRADETDSALALAGVQRRAVGLATEADSALSLAGVQLRAAGLASETDTALAMARLQIGAVGIANETDNALALSAAGAQPTGIASETDTAFALDGVQVGIVIPQTSFAEFSGGVVKTKAVPKQPRIKAPKARAKAEPKLAPIVAPVGMAIEVGEAFALSVQLVQRGLLRTEPVSPYPQLTRANCSHCGAPMSAHRQP